MRDCGFELLRDQYIAELGSRAYIWHHVQSGAELLSLENDDRNKAFGIMFRTRPTDASGLPHVLEHAVLGGSRKYPLKDPLGQVLAGSLVTYVNALTYPDKTGYLVSSTHVTDLYNIADVFLDAVFYPLLKRETFKRVGWHYELDSPEDPLTVNGIVLNEQRGNWASAMRLTEHHSQMPLFPNTPYGVPRGGDPLEIPNLTYERLVAYHKTCYHPSNARVYFYGNDDPRERLRFMDAWLKDFDRVEVDSAFPLQPSFERPRCVTIPYDAGQETGEAKGIVTLNWVLDEVGDPGGMIAWEILAHILIGTPASPLRMATVESGLGQGLAGLGLFNHVRQMYFSTGLTGVRPGDVDQVEALIVETLRRLADEGLDPGTVAAALNAIGFQLREASYGPFPRGLALFWHRASTTWIHDGDPLSLLAFEGPLQAIVACVERGDRYFERLIQLHLVDNPHRATVVLVPDATARPERVERKRLDEKRDAMSENELRALLAETEAFRRVQETPDPPEVLARIPRLEVGDLDRQSPQIPCYEDSVAGCPVLYHDLPTQGIFHLDLAFDLCVLPGELLPYAPLLGQALIGMGTEAEDHIVFGQRIGRRTGGILPSFLTSATMGTRQAIGRLVLRSKATVVQSTDLLEVLRDVLLFTKLDNQECFAQLVTEAIARIESRLLLDGADVVSRRLGAKYGKAGWLDEQLSGIEQLLFLRRLAKEIESDWPEVLSKLGETRRRLIHRGALVCNVTVDGANWKRLRPGLEQLVSSLSLGSVHPVYWHSDPLSVSEGLAASSQVHHVAKGANLYDLGYELCGSIAAVVGLLNMAWLSEQIRVRGGAYAGFCSFDRRTGLFAFCSYRDPNLLATIDIFDQSASFLREMNVDEAIRDRCIVGGIGRLDAYLLPGDKGYASMLQNLVGENQQARQQFRDELLGTTAQDIRAFADVLKCVQAQGSVVVMGSREALAEANAARGDWLQVIEVL